MTQTGRVEEREKLINLISQWNQDHYDIFEISQPNEDLDFHGVVRFYFQDKGEVVTKCIRVSSSASTDEVVQVLVEKFRPDMRMLTNNEYALYEVHVNGEERKLNKEESVLMVQLNWGNDVREGRFLLKREGVPTIAANEKEQQTFKRKLSKREKKEKKKQEKKGKENDASVAEKLYSDMPESKFTRSISNPEAVMKRRRQQKVEKKLQQCRGQDGHGGTLKIYGETLKPDIPYKTLLLSTTDNVAYVIKEALEKYGLEKQITPEDLNLVQVLVPPEVEYHGGTIGDERIMEDQECPLSIAMHHPQNKGTMLFQLKLKSDSRKGKHKKMRSVSHDDLRYPKEEPPVQKLPYLVELNPDGSDNPKGKVHRLNLKFTEVGSDRSMYIQILGPNIQPRHCVIGLTHNDGIVTVTPTSPESETYVNNQRVYETTTLQNGMTVRFGKLSIFRFLDPNFEERMRKGQMPMEEAIQKRGMPPFPGKVPETNFDVDGRVETMDGASSRGSDRGHPQDELQKSRSPHNQSFGSQAEERGPMSPPQQKNIEEALPAALEFRDEKEDAFLSAVILDGNNAATQYKLSPTYILYMAVRYCLSNAYRPEMTPSDRALRLTQLVNKIANMSHQAIQTSRDNPAALAFWMANASEILHFFKQDHDIHPFSQDAQEMLAESVQMAFHHLVRCLQYDLQRTMPAFLDENDSVEEDEMMMQEDGSRVRYNRGNKPNLGDVLDTLSSAMNLLRRCRVNAALTIQLFSQLFHFINMWLFNILVANRQPHQFCTRAWGMRLKRRLGRIETWAEKQGLELAADCHLCRIIQAAHLLQAPKSNPDDIADISSTCFKLNSMQLRELLQRYIPEHGEPPIPHNLIERIVSVAENMADELTKTDGREVRLEEDSDLQLPFLLPEDGYSCDTIRGIPNGLREFVEPLVRGGLCRMIAQPTSREEWTVYMSNGDGPRIEEAVRKNQQGPQTPEPRPQPQLPKEPEVVSVTFNKVKGSMGLSIVAAKGDGQKERGIYIKSVVPNGAADIDGRLQAGDQLLEVDGKSLVGLTQEKAAELMTRTGQTVTLKVAKQGAFYHGLATLLSQPSPIMQRASPKKPASPMMKQRPQEEGPPPYNGNMDMDRRHLPAHHAARQAAMQSPQSRSSPSLNKYRKGITHKDMENIYSRDALWRLVLQAEKSNLIAKSFGSHLPASITSNGEVPNNSKKMDEDVWSKSVGALDRSKSLGPYDFLDYVTYPSAAQLEKGGSLDRSRSFGPNGYVKYRNRAQCMNDLNSKDDPMYRKRVKSQGDLSPNDELMYQKHVQSQGDIRPNGKLNCQNNVQSRGELRPSGNVVYRHGVQSQNNMLSRHDMPNRSDFRHTKSVQSQGDLRYEKLHKHEGVVDIRELQADVRQMQHLQTMDDSKIQYNNEPRGRLRQKKMNQQERRQRSKSTSDLHRMKIAQAQALVDGDEGFMGYDINGGLGHNDHKVVDELHDKMRQFHTRQKEKLAQLRQEKKLKQLTVPQENVKVRVPLSPLNDFNEKIQRSRGHSSGYHSMSGTSDISTSDDVFNEPHKVVMREKKGHIQNNRSHSDGNKWNLDYDSVFGVNGYTSDLSERSYDNSSMREASRRLQTARHGDRKAKSQSFDYGSHSLPRHIQISNQGHPRYPLKFHSLQRSQSAYGGPVRNVQNFPKHPRSLSAYGGTARSDIVINGYHGNDSYRDSYSSVSVSSDSYRLSDGYIHSQGTVGFITRHPRSKSITSLPSRDGTGSDRGRPTASARDLRDTVHGSPHHVQQAHPDRAVPREVDPKSKSIPNLRMDTSFEQQRDPQHNMRPAASVGALQNAGQFHDYYNQRPDPREMQNHGNDYENAPNVDPRFQKPNQDIRNDRGYPEVHQTMPPGGQFGKQQHTMDRGPPGSRGHPAGQRDERPQSAYFGHAQDKPVVRNERPVSMEVNPNRMDDWQQRFGMDDKFGGQPHAPHPLENSFENRDPNYVNTPSQQLQNGGYVNQGDIPKLTANNELRQPNFYENTVARQQEPTPAFHQLRRPQSESEMKQRPSVAAKPFVAPKPTTPKVPPTEIPRVDVNHRNLQPQFYDPRLQHEQRSPGSAPSNYIPGRPLMTHSHSTGFNDPRIVQGGGNKGPHGGREMYNSHTSPELPPPPNEVPPELPPPPSSDDLPEELPPLPPPPVTDYKPMQPIDPQYANHPMDPGFNGPHSFPYGQRDNPKVIGYAGPQQQQPTNMQPSPPQQTSLKLPQGFHPSNDYQNINYDNRHNRSFESHPQHSPGHVYETYDSKAQTLPNSYQPPMYDSKAQSLPANYQAPPHIQQQLQQQQQHTNNLQQSRNRLVNEMNELSSKFNKDGKNQSLVSPWDRDEKEKLEKMQEVEMNRLREQEISDLESRSYLSPQEQDRLRKLRLEQEFQRRVQEVSSKDDDEEDSDNDITNNTQAGREFLIQTIQEDINKAQRRLEELNQRRLYEEYEREKDRMERLERKLEIFEKEREERQQRLQKRQQKKQKEQEEYQRKQRELRDKQRAEYEEQKRIHMLEEEKLRQRKMEEMQRQKELERERLQEIQAQKEAEEAAFRAEARRREEEYRRQELEQKERERREQQREIRVNEERKRLEALANQNQGYQQYANLPPQPTTQFAPPPPQRVSSYDVAGNRTNSNARNNDIMQNSYTGNEGFRGLNSTGMRNPPEIPTKKSVSFNTQLETLNRYSVTSEEDRTPHASQSSYRSSHSSTSSDPHSPHSINSHPPFGHSGPIPPTANNISSDSVFDTPPQQNHISADVKYRTAENTPGVIGAQEIYRDPRNRIEAEKSQPKKPGPDRMSFRDKMKYFAQESGESTIKNRPKASKALRQIESQLHNGQ